MNILFPTISTAIQNIDNRGIYPDLVRKLASEGHRVYVIFPIDRRKGVLNSTTGNISQLGIPFTRITKAPLPERLWSMFRIASVFERSIEKNWSGIQFDLILYATPPITFNRLVQNLKIKHKASTFLMLKDIFPQNAVDLGMISKNGVAYNRFKKQEEKLYELSDRIGCMSSANVHYLRDHVNTEIGDRALICPNAIEIRNAPLTPEEKLRNRDNFKLPRDKVLVIYGGNLGKPQGVHFLKEVIKHYKDSDKTHFVICGAGTESKSLRLCISRNDLHNVTFFSGMDRFQYDQLEACADIALVFLDARFTIPNYPSRILSYMENALPILFSVDSATDVGKDAEINGYGISTLHGDLNQFTNAMDNLVIDKALRNDIGRKGREYLQNNFSVSKAYDAIFNKVN